MGKKLEARVVVTEKKDGGREMSLYDPATGRNVELGPIHAHESTEARVKQMKETMERAGNHATVVERRER